MSGLDLDAIEARANAASEGPWRADTSVEGDCVIWGRNRDQWLANTDSGDSSRPDEFPGWPVVADHARANTEFLAHARTDVPALIAEVRRLRAQVAGVTVTTIPSWPGA